MHANASHTAARRGRVLVIEGDAVHASALRELLEREGFQATAIRTGFEGEDAAAAEAFDAVIVQAVLPDRNGTSVVQNLRRRRVPAAIVMLSPCSAMDSKVMALAAGADDYIVTPYEPKDLMDRLRDKIAIKERAGGSRLA